jgi:hypothetical protein
MIVLLELLGVLLVLTQTSQFHPHARSLLIFTNPISPARVFMNAFTVLPLNRMAGSAVPNSYIGRQLASISTFWSLENT